jgi:hypothetical protein
MPTPTYIVFASVEDYGEFDQRLAAEMATFKEATAEEKGQLKVGSEGIISQESNLRSEGDPRSRSGLLDAKIAVTVIQWTLLLQPVKRLPGNRMCSPQSADW